MCTPGHPPARPPPAPECPPRISLLSSPLPQPHTDPEVIREILSRQVTSPVQWETTLKTLLERGLERSYEIGPNKVRMGGGGVGGGEGWTKVVLGRGGGSEGGARGTHLRPARNLKLLRCQPGSQRPPLACMQVIAGTLKRIDKSHPVENIVA